MVRARANIGHVKVKVYVWLYGIIFKKLTVICGESNKNSESNIQMYGKVGLWSPLCALLHALLAHSNLQNSVSWRQWCLDDDSQLQRYLCVVFFFRVFLSQCISLARANYDHRNAQYLIRHYSELLLNRFVHKFSVWFAVRHVGSINTSIYASSIDLACSNRFMIALLFQMHHHMQRHLHQSS